MELSSNCWCVMWQFFQIIALYIDCTLSAAEDIDLVFCHVTPTVTKYNVTSILLWSYINMYKGIKKGLQYESKGWFDIFILNPMTNYTNYYRCAHYTYYYRCVKTTCMFTTRYPINIEKYNDISNLCVFSTITLNIADIHQIWSQ